MKKILQIGWKDLRVIFRDRAALILMLLAPFAMTIGMGLVTGTLTAAEVALARYRWSWSTWTRAPLGMLWSNC